MSNSTKMGSSTTNAASRTWNGFMLVKRAQQPADRQSRIGEAGEDEETCDQHLDLAFI